MEMHDSEAGRPATSLEFPLSSPCTHKQSDRIDCCCAAARGPVVCNVLNIDRIRACPRYYRMATRHTEMSELWGEVCCEDYRALMLRCAEPDGWMAGAIDLRRYPNDGNDVWRNYEHVHLQYCPFCGTRKEPA